jgi:hypothetical protein
VGRGVKVGVGRVVDERAEALGKVCTQGKEILIWDIRKRERK